MCISAAIAAGVSLVSAGVSAVSSISGANAAKANAKYKNDLETKQINERLQIEELSAMEQEHTRLDDFERTRSSAMAAMGASGVAENVSFFQGIDPEQYAARNRDVTNIRQGIIGERASLADQIQVGAFGTRIAAYNSKMTKIGAYADFAKAASSSFTAAKSYSVPKARG